MIAVLAFALAACPKPSDYTPQIRVVPGAAARIGLMRSKAPRRAGDDASEHAPQAPARASVLTSSTVLKGPQAVGAPGDLVLENGEVVFVISRLGTSAGFAESGGNLVDAADSTTRVDELGQVFTCFGAFPRQAVYDTLTSGALPANDPAAFVEARGHELYEPALAVTTRYTLRAGDRALLIETTLTNGSDHAIAGLRLGDAIQWGAAEKYAPGKAVGFRGASKGPFIGAVGRAASYAITSTDGVVEAMSGSSWTDTMQTAALTMKPGDAVQYARVFVVGPRGDTAGLVGELARASGAAVGALDVILVDDHGVAVAAEGGASIALTPASADGGVLPGAEALSIGTTAGHDGFTGDVPPGRYAISYAGGAGRRGLAGAVVDVAPNAIARATLAVSAASRLAVTCVEGAAPVPCKVTIEGAAGAATPSFGPAHYAGPAKNQITTGADGVADVPLAPGKYKVTASRGPEYALDVHDVTLEAGAALSVAAHLVRVVDTRDYLATDFHQHTMLGADAPVGLRDRVIANAAEGVEVAVASEHNVVADLEPLVRELGLARFLVEIAGNELTTDASRTPWGHANVFPLTVDATKDRGGASVVRDRSPREIFAELRGSGDARTPRVIQINHPRTGTTGYFDQLAFDPKTGVGRAPGYDAGFDAVEVWNGRNVDGRAQVVNDVFALLRTGHPVTMSADTDTHGIVGQEAGYPRTYVGVANDGDLDAFGSARVGDLVDGVKMRRDVVLTNGPFLRVRANGAPVGGIVKAASGRVRVVIHVECAPWVDVTSVRIARASRSFEASDAEAKVTLTRLASGAMGADVVREINVTKDDAIVVVATGERPLTPVLGGDPHEILPFAMTGALWIDADGDGKALAR